MSTDADKVRAAADYIERVGLHKGSIADGPLSAQGSVAAGYRCCTLGALWGHGFDDWVNDSKNPFGGKSLLREFLGTDVPRWNDAPERTADEVVTALRAFADTLDAQP